MDHDLQQLEEVIAWRKQEDKNSAPKLIYSCNVAKGDKKNKISKLINKEHSLNDINQSRVRELTDQSWLLMSEPIVLMKFYEYNKQQV